MPKLQRNIIEIPLWHGCSSVNLLLIFRTLFPENTSEGLLLHLDTGRKLNVHKTLKVRPRFKRERLQK